MFQVRPKSTPKSVLIFQTMEEEATVAYYCWRRAVESRKCNEQTASNYRGYSWYAKHPLLISLTVRPNQKNKVHCVGPINKTVFPLQAKKVSKRSRRTASLILTSTLEWLTSCPGRLPPVPI
jgi:hypothetical protein